MELPAAGKMLVSKYLFTFEPDANANQRFIVDDHYMVIEGIRSLSAQWKGDWVGRACVNPLSLYGFFCNNGYPLMDINLPDKSGIELCELVKRYPGVFIVGLSTF